LVLEQVIADSVLEVEVVWDLRELQESEEHKTLMQETAAMVNHTI
jgi:hypothetical protein